MAERFRVKMTIKCASLLLTLLCIFWPSTAVSMIDMQSAAYKLIIDRIEIVNDDPSEARFTVKMFKYNRTLTTYNFTLYLSRDFLPNGTEEIEFQTFEFLNNEYKPFAIHTRRSLCEFLSTTYKIFFVQDLGEGFVPTRCPVEKGLYETYNYSPESRNYPNMPFNKMRINVKIWVGDIKKKVIIEMIGYVRLDRNAAFRDHF